MQTLLKPRWARRKDARPKELLSAALDAFVEHGFAATKLEQVARNAGVSKGTLYLYFENKDDLFKAVVRETIVPNIEQAENLLIEYQGNTKDLFREIITQWHRSISAPDMAGICKLMFAEASNFPEMAEFYHAEVIQRNEQMIVRLLERGMKSGEFRLLDLTVMPKIIAAPMVMLMLWSKSFCSQDQHPLDVEAYLASYIETMLSGLLKK
ncbi:AcrR family transcriptional regulator [Oxalobacteraceae bacterium GrIS 2.11]